MLDYSTNTWKTYIFEFNTKKMHNSKAEYFIRVKDPSVKLREICAMFIGKVWGNGTVFWNHTDVHVVPKAMYVGNTFVGGNTNGKCTQPENPLWEEDA